MINSICICGAGTMGSGIAQLSAQAGFSTIQFDVNSDMLDKSRQLIDSNLGKLVAKGKLTNDEKHDCLGRIIMTSDIRDCMADLVIEAIVESVEIKEQLYQSLAAVNAHTTIFASNTSSLSIEVLATAVPRPEHFAGMHFFNPAPLMKLVEIVRAPQTAVSTIDTLLQVAKLMGKTAVVCRDAPGFIVNRVARHYYLEAMQLVEQGLTDVKTIDTIMEATGFRMGPFALMDLIGMDINYNVSKIVWQSLGHPQRLKPSLIQQAKVESGELGRKTGRGFYEYGGE